jgi:hypothetical protein
MIPSQIVWKDASVHNSPLRAGPTIADRDESLIAGDTLE